MTDAPRPEPSAAEPIPAATLVLFRERADAMPELLIVERAQKMAFAAGALVFPGGRIDPADRDLATAVFPGDPHGAGRIAAIRETIEEAGLAVGLAASLRPAGRAASVPPVRALSEE